MFQAPGTGARAGDYAGQAEVEDLADLGITFAKAYTEKTHRESPPLVEIEMDRDQTSSRPRMDARQGRRQPLMCLWNQSDLLVSSRFVAMINGIDLGEGIRLEACDGGSAYSG